jgi:putative acetyltransferase
MDGEVMAEVVRLEARDAEALGALSVDPSVVRFGDHVPHAPLGAAWIGSSDRDRGVTLGVYEAERLVAAARLGLSTSRRRVHAADLSVLARWEPDADAPLDALLSALLRAADRWLTVGRIELRAPAEHPRVQGLYAARGFTVEARHRASLRTDGRLVDEVTMARIRPGFSVGQEESPLPPPPDKGAPVRVRLRPQRASDVETVAEILSEEAVVVGTFQVPWQPVELWRERYLANDPERLILLVAESEDEGQLLGLGTVFVQGTLRRRHEARSGCRSVDRIRGVARVARSPRAS